MRDKRDKSFITSSIKDNRLHIALHGNWDYTLSGDLLHTLRKLLDTKYKVIIDFSNVKNIDFAFVKMLLLHLENKDYTLDNLTQKQEKMLNLVSQTKIKKSHKFIFPFLYHAFSHIRHAIKDFFADMLNFMNFLGAILRYLGYLALHPSKIRFSSFMYHINESGFRALPVILLTCFIVSYAITLQGVIQMEQFGMPLLSVEITAKLALREIGPFIMALVIAGRSASSFTAQIGVGNLTQESDAMKVMNFDIINFLVIPRLLALIIVMPLMVFLADWISLVAGMLALKMQAGVTFTQYAERFYEFVNINHFLIGLAKAPFFGAAIALVGTFRGFNIKDNTQNVGLYTTISVVNAMFWIILINAIFSLITTRLNV